MGHTRVVVLLGLLSISSAGCSGCRNGDPQQAARPDSESRNQRDQDPVADAAPDSPASEADVATSPPPGRNAEAAVRAPADDRDASTSRTSESGGSAAGSPEDALSRARDLQSSAQAKRQQGDHQGAFEDAREAWSLVRQFPDDPACRGLADALYAELDEFTDRADAGNGVPPTNDTPLILQ